MKFELEAKHDKDITVIDCNTLLEEKAKCQLAKWNHDKLLRVQNLSDGFFSVSVLLGFLMIVFQSSDG